MKVTEVAAETVLEIGELEVNFGGFKAVDSFSMTVDQGELRVLIGANGAGKTTLMDLITGRTKSTSGVVRFMGRDITNGQEHKIARQGIGRKFQVPSVFKELSVRQNLAVAQTENRSVWHNLLPRSRRRERVGGIEQALERCGLEDEADNAAGNLSHGQVQWLELGMVLVQNPNLILLDEPTAGMTGIETEKTSAIINSLKGTHTLIVVEHDMTFVRAICEIITVMHLGKKLAEGTVEQIENDPAVIDAYLGSGGITHA